ncbi:MAG: TetR/AcrR family transcriptional regulator [Myxococcota bacterium]
MTTKERVLSEACDLLVERGEAAVTMRAVAARAGITPMAIYRHFKGREALVRAILEEGHALFLRYLQRTLVETTPWGRLLASGEAYLEFALKHPRHYDLMFMRAVDLGRPRGPRSWQDAATFRFLVDRIRECVDAGLLSAEDPEAVALTVWAQVHGLVSLFLAQKLEVDAKAFRALYAHSLEHLVRAYAVPPSTPYTTTRRTRRTGGRK